MFNRHDTKRNYCQLSGAQARLGYDWWWHSFTGKEAETGEEKPFFIEFFLCNPSSGGKEPVFGQLPQNREKGIRPSYLMVKAGAWGEDASQLHRFWGWDTIEVEMNGPLSIKADDCELSETFTKGRVEVSLNDSSNHPEWMCQAGAMSWELSIVKKTAFNVGWGASGPMRRLQLFEMFWHAEGMATAYQGAVWWKDRKYIVSPDTCYGYADKNWGKGFTSPWVWLSSCNLTSLLTGEKLKDSVFDIGGGRPKIGPLVLERKLLSAFWYEGRGYEFNFSKFWTFCRTKFSCHETETQIVWHVDQRTWIDHMVVDVTCEKKNMLLVKYESPDGKHRHRRLWNGGNGKGEVKLFHRGILVDHINAENVGCEYGEYDTEEPYGAIAFNSCNVG